MEPTTVPTTPQPEANSGGFNPVIPVDAKAELDKLFAARDSGGGEPPKQDAPAPAPSATPQEPAKPAEPQKTAADAPIDFSKVDADAWRPKKADDWNKVKAKMAALEAEKQAYEDRLKNALVGDEAERIRKENEESRRVIREFMAERDPQVQQAYKAKLDAAVSTAIRAVPESKRKALERAIRTMDPETASPDDFDGYFDGIGPAQQAFLIRGLQEADTAIREHRTRVAEATANFDKHQQQLMTQAQQQANQRRQAFEQAFEDRVKLWQNPETGHPLLVPRNGDDQHNAQAKELISSAHALLFDEAADPAELVNAAMWAFTAPRLLQSYQSVSKENETLKAELARLTKSSPSMDGAAAGQPDAGDEIKTAVESGKTPGAILVSGMRKAGLF